MFRRTYNSIVVGLTAFCLLVSSLDAAVRIRVSRNSPSNALSSRATSIYGGVFLQSEAQFISANKTDIKPERVRLSHYDEATETLYLECDGARFALKIADDMLSRLISWIDNEGKGLYTGYKLGGDIGLDQGLARLPNGHGIAAEFADYSRAVEVVQYMDFFNQFLVEDPDNSHELLKRINEGVTQRNGAKYLDWMTSDMDSRFVVALRNSAVTPNGTLFVYHRRESNSKTRVFVQSVRQFVEGSAEELEEMLGSSSDAKSISLKHRGALDLAQAAATLRAIRKHNRESWDKFADGYFTETVDYEASK